MPQDSGQTNGDDGLAAALAHVNAGRYDAAEAICRAAVATRPEHAQAWHLLGAIALQRGDAAGAIEHCRRAVALAPALAKAHSNLGAALAATGRAEEAIGVLETALRAEPSLVSAHVNLGDALMKAGRFEGAVAVLRRAAALDPGYTLAQVNLGAALTRLNRLDEAIAVLSGAVAQHPRLAQAHNNLGFALHKNLQHEAALAAFERARALDPSLADVSVNLGLAYGALGRPEEAVAAFDQALALRPGFHEPVFFRALEHLRRGRFAEGWRDYGHRFSVRKTAAALHREPLAADLAGHAILVLRDQGLGDEIFFLRFAPEMKRRGAHVSYLANGKIASLLRRLPILDQVVTDDQARPPADFVVSAGDLPALLEMSSAAAIPPSLAIPVLADRLAAARGALRAAGPPPYVGVTWRAGTDQLGTLYKSIPRDRLGAALARTAGTLIALQRLPEAGEIAALSAAAGRAVQDFSAWNERLEDMLALVSLLDDYVTVSNTNVHLRAAAGKASRVLVPWPPEFRWMAEGAASPWFPDCSVYRQAMDGAWDGALTALAADLAAVGDGPSRPADDGARRERGR